MVAWVYRPDHPQANNCGMVPKDLVPPEENKSRSDLQFWAWRDIPPYMSPLGTGLVEGRTARKRELEKHNCREVEPSEFRPQYTEAFRQKHGIPDPD